MQTAIAYSVRWRGGLMGQHVDAASGLILRNYDIVGYYGRAGEVRLFTADEARRLLGYKHLRHIYWLVENGHLPYRKFGRELVFTQNDIEQFRLRRGY